jgi:hypothetical protein
MDKKKKQSNIHLLCKEEKKAKCGSQIWAGAGYI